MFPLTVIPPHTRIDGRVDTPADLVLEGRLEGDLFAGGTATITARGACYGSIRARVARIRGVVTGPVTCSEAILVEANARVSGDLRAPEISIAEGAEVHGEIDRLVPVDPAELEIDYGERAATVASDAPAPPASTPARLEAPTIPVKVERPLAAREPGGGRPKTGPASLANAPRPERDMQKKQAVAPPSEREEKPAGDAAAESGSPGAGIRRPVQVRGPVPVAPRPPRAPSGEARASGRSAGKSTGG